MPFIETDFRKRKPHPNYKMHYDVENEVIGIARKYRSQIGLVRLDISTKDCICVVVYLQVFKCVCDVALCCTDKCLLWACTHVSRNAYRQLPFFLSDVSRTTY